MKSVVFLGTPQFSVPILKGLNEKYDIKAVVTQPDKPVGRKHLITPSPVKKTAEELKIKLLQPAKIGGSKEMDEIIKMNPDFIITAAYGQFLPDKLLNAAKIASVNVHGSLLPKYRGGAPVQYAIMNGDKETGITIMYMVKQMDAGDIITQQSIEIGDTDDTESMFGKLSIIGRNLLLETLPKIADNTINPVKQNQNEVIFSPNIKKSEEELDFNQPARLVDAKVRALRPDPGAFLISAEHRVKIWNTSVVSEKTELNPGQVVERNKHNLWIAAGDSTVLSINEIQPAGKPRKNITEYLNGNQNLKVGDQFVDVK